MRVELTNHSGYLNIMKTYEILMLLKLHGFGNGDAMESSIFLFCNTGSSVSVRQRLSRSGVRGVCRPGIRSGGKSGTCRPPAVLALDASAAPAGE